ncbi:MAG: hypothetical protein ACYCX4_17350 [Bacillota bacterium]
MKTGISEKRGDIDKETGEIQALEQDLSKLRLVIDSLKTAPEYRQRLQDGASLENEVESVTKNVNELSKKFEAINGVIAKLEQKLEQKKEEVSASEKVLDTLNADKKKHEDKKPEDRNTILHYRDGLHKFSGNMQETKTSCKAHDVR